MVHTARLSTGPRLPTGGRGELTGGTDLSKEQLLHVLKPGLIVALLGLVGYIDATTGYEISIFPLYALPIALTVRFFGIGAGMAAAGLAALLWMWADIAAGHVYSQPWIMYVNSAGRLLFFLFVALAVGYMIGNRRRARSQLRNFSGTLPVCTACSRVRDRNGYWWDVQSYLREFGGALTRAKLCPDCAHEAYVPDEHSGAAAPR